MIEIIQEENWEGARVKRELPRNVKQMGTPDAGDRIYIENDAYQKMHPYGKCPEKLVYVLMGRFDKVAENDCTFIEDAIEMPEIEFQGNLPVWTDESWGCLYRKLCPEHDNMVIVGWAVDICGQFPGMTAQLEYIHHNYFGGTHQVLMLLDSLEREEVFYSNKNGYLKRRTGFYVCNNGVLLRKEEKSYTSDVREKIDKHHTTDYDEDAVRLANEHEFRRQESYREYLNNRRHDMRGGMPPQKQGFHLSTLLLLMVIAGLGYSAWQNQQKADEMQQALAQMTSLQTSVEQDWNQNNANGVSSDETIVRVEEIIGSVIPDTSQSDTATLDEQQPAGTVASSEEESIVSTQTLIESTQVPSTQMTTSEVVEDMAASAPVLSEAERYLQQGYYIVQSGDSLAGICQKIYHTSAMMEQICELNKIENPDAIYAGQYLKLP